MQTLVVQVIHVGSMQTIHHFVLQHLTQGGVKAKQAFTLRRSNCMNVHALQRVFSIQINDVHSILHIARPPSQFVREKHVVTQTLLNIPN
jgi:hypothetical protein